MSVAAYNGQRIFTQAQAKAGVLEKLARNAAVGAAAEDLWSPGGTLTFQTANVACEIVSSNAADADAGAGARTVRVSGVQFSGSTLVRVTEDIGLNGVAAVPLQNQYARIDRLDVIERGTYGAGNVGTIDARVVAGAVIQAQIPVDAVFGGVGRDQGSLVCVPSNQYAVLLGVTVGVQAGQTGTVMLFYRERPTDVAAAFEGSFGPIFGAEGLINVRPLDLPGPIYFPPNSEFWWRGACSANAIVTLQQAVQFVGV